MQSFIQGLLFGIGFTISLLALAAIAVFSASWGDVTAEGSAELAQDMMREMKSVEGIVVLSHEESARGKDVAVLGKIKNEGKAARSNYALEVELFDKDDKFVDLCRESYFGSIGPGEERHFKVTCHACRGSSVPEHARYEIRVTE